VDLFTNVCGVFIHFKDEAVPETVRSWNVRALPLPRSSRNSDVTVAADLFAAVRKFLDAKGKGPVHAGCIPKALRYA